MSPPDGAPRIVVLTAGNPYGVGVVRRLAERGVACTVLLQSEAALRDCFRQRGWRRALELPVALGRAGVRARRTRGWRRALTRWSRHVVTTGARNSPRLVAALARLAPDVLVLAGVGVVDERVLDAARWGALNGHPGLLPWVRGNGVVAHAVAEGIALGASVHRVDRGIDTGAVLARRLLPVSGEETLDQLERAAVALAATTLADVVEAVVRDGALPQGTPQAERHPLRRWMEPAAWRAVADAVARGEARALFERWRGCCEPPAAPWELPPALRAPPRA